jgi:hypothetical protein
VHTSEQAVAAKLGTGDRYVAAVSEVAAWREMCEELSDLEWKGRRLEWWDGVYAVIPVSRINADDDF